MSGGENMRLPFSKYPGWGEAQGKHVCIQVGHAFTHLERLSPKMPPLQMQNTGQGGLPGCELSQAGEVARVLLGCSGFSGPQVSPGLAF